MGINITNKKIDRFLIAFAAWKVVFGFLAVMLATTSCKNPTDKEKIAGKVTIYLKDSLLKSDIKIDSIVVSAIDTISDKKITAYIINTHLQRSEAFLKLGQTYISMGVSENKIKRLYKVLGATKLIDLQNDEIKTSMNTATNYLDTAKMYASVADSLTKIYNKIDSTKALYYILHPQIFGTKKNIIAYRDSLLVLYDGNRIIEEYPIVSDFIRTK